MTIATRILYIEDAPALGALFTRIVTRLGYDVDVATTGKGGLALYDADPHDIVFLDYNLPDTDGITLARTILLKHPDKLIVLVTGEGSERLASEALSLGVTDYIVKDNEKVFVELIPSILVKLDRTLGERTEKYETDVENSRLKAITENMLDVVSVLDAEGRTTFISPSVKTVLGYSVEERIGKKSFDLVHPDDLKALMLKFSAGLQGVAKTETTQYRFKHKNGSWVHLESTARNLMQDPLVNGVIVHSRDVSDRIKEQQKYQSIVDSSIQGIVIHRRGKILYSNTAAAQVFGYQNGLDLVEVGNIFHIINEADHSTAREIQEYDNSSVSSPSVVEIKGAHRTGKTLFIEAAANQIEWEGMRATQIALIDRTEKRLAEDQLKSSEEKHRELVSLSPVCIHEINAEGEIISMNPAGVAMMGADSEADVCGLRYLDVPIHEDQARIRGLMKRAFEGVPSEFEFRASGEDSTLHFSSSFQPVVDSTGNVIRLMGVTQDITEQKKAEEALLESEKRFADIAESSSDFFWDIDEKLQFTGFSGDFIIENSAGNQPLNLTRWDVASEEDLLDEKKWTELSDVSAYGTN